MHKNSVGENAHGIANVYTIHTSSAQLVTKSEEESNPSCRHLCGGTNTSHISLFFCLAFSKGLVILFCSGFGLHMCHAR